MDWLVIISETSVQMLGWLAALAVPFGILVRFMPCNRGMYWWKDLRAAGTDFLYWFLLPLFVRVSRTLLLAGGVAFLCHGISPGFAVIHRLPLWQQCGAVLLIQDVMLYWIHRGF